MSAPNNMRQPTGVTANSHVVVDDIDFQEREHNKRPFIGGPISRERYRVLQHDVVWARRPKIGLGRLERANVQGEVRGFSVLNRVGHEGESEDDFYQQHRIVGLSIMNMQPHAIKTDANIRIAVHLKGPTWMRNNNPDETIRAGDLVCARIPSSTADAERREAALGRPEGGIPSQRYTAFPSKWDPGHVTRAIRNDVNSALRSPAQQQRYTIPSTPDVIRSLRTMAIAGVCLAHGYYDPAQRPDDTDQFTHDLRNAAGGADRSFVALVNDIARGVLDDALAALLIPTSGERIVGTARLPPQTQEAVRHLHHMQTGGFANLTTTVENSVTSAGRDRILGRAITNGPPGETFGILLSG